MKLVLEKKMENQNSHLVDEKCKQWGEIIVVQYATVYTFKIIKPEPDY